MLLLLDRSKLRHMSDSWVTRALSNNSTPVEMTEDVLDEKGVILLQGTNIHGDPIYSYLQLTIRSLQQLRDRMRSGEKFLPADFGEVLAAGRGEPDNELRSEMAVTYNLVDAPNGKKRYEDTLAKMNKAVNMQAQQQAAPQPAAPEAPNQPSGKAPGAFSQPSIWDD